MRSEKERVGEGKRIKRGWKLTVMEISYFRHCQLVSKNPVLHLHRVPKKTKPLNFWPNFVKS